AYPEVRSRMDLIVNVLRSEEEKFTKTLAGGMARLDEEIRTVKSSSGNSLSGSVAFSLYDTYGFPIELTEELLQAQGLSVDLAGFDELMSSQRKRAQEGNKMFLDVFSGGEQSIADLQKIAGKTEFVGYDATDSEATVKAILLEGALVDVAEEGDTVQIVLDRSPFYAESGGQVGDFGEIKSESGLATVSDTKKTADIWLHQAAIATGEIKVGDKVRASVYGDRRSSIMRNHTATHLLHSALRRFLGTHVAQAGSLVASERLRFDFSHFQAMTGDELRQVEDDVNKHILADLEVSRREMGIQEAREQGAMALFGEKYGDIVRTVTIGEVSMELCGGTHLNRTSEIGLFKIVAETSIAAGVRRLEAVTGHTALEYVRTLEERLRDIAGKLAVPQTEILPAIDKLQATLKEQQKAIAALKSKSSGEEIELLIEGAVQVDSFKAVCARTDTTDADAMSQLADQLADKLGSAVVVLGSEADGKVLFVTKVTKDLMSKGLHAGNLIKSIAQEAGGGGGGRPDFAKAGGKDPSKLSQALDKALVLIKEAVG
ncbi:MAG: alanine--tRNA ligase, partial [Armatimonadota bacterium]